MIRAFGHNLTTSDKNLILKMATILDPTLPVIVIDLVSYEAEAGPDDILFLFGARSVSTCTKLKCFKRLEFGAVAPLTAGDETAKKAAYAKLLYLQKELAGGRQEVHIEEPAESTAQSVHIDEGLLPNITANQVSDLERQQRQQGKDYWEGVTRDGKTIRVSIEPMNSPADINLTFVELYAVLGLMEAFRVKELDLVYKPSKTNSN